MERRKEEKKDRRDGRLIVKNRGVRFALSFRAPPSEDTRFVHLIIADNIGLCRDIANCCIATTPPNFIITANIAFFDLPKKAQRALIAHEYGHFVNEANKNEIDQPKGYVRNLRLELEADKLAISLVGKKQFTQALKYIGQNSTGIRRIEIETRLAHLAT